MRLREEVKRLIPYERLYRVKKEEMKCAAEIDAGESGGVEPAGAAGQSETTAESAKKTADRDDKAGKSGAKAKSAPAKKAKAETSTNEAA